MANVHEAIQYVLREEDATLSGVITDDSGGRTRFGIAEKFHPELNNSLFYDSMGSVAAQKVAESIYEREYCEPLCIPEIASQEIANKLLSLGVNCGITKAAKMLQDALAVPGDGRIGPITLDAIDHAAASGYATQQVMHRLREIAVLHYEDVIKKNPAMARFEHGWLRRAKA
jgi:lysozyme family protein